MPATLTIPPAIATSAKLNLPFFPESNKKNPSDNKDVIVITNPDHRDSLSTTRTDNNNNKDSNNNRGNNNKDNNNEPKTSKTISNDESVPIQANLILSPMRTRTRTKRPLLQDTNTIWKNPEIIFASLSNNEAFAHKDTRL